MALPVLRPTARACSIAASSYGWLAAGELLPNVIVSLVPLFMGLLTIFQHLALRAFWVSNQR
jgi:hypothetical protein